MKASPLNLLDYYITELSVSANKAFNLQKPSQLKFEDLVVQRNLVHLDNPKGPPWELRLQVRHAAAPERNAAYGFALELVGHFEVPPSFPPERVKTLIEVNGASMLYGAARQVIRNATAQGPHNPVLLPSASFYEPKESAPAAK
jgi:preprotein translocase subunit SecB